MVSSVYFLGLGFVLGLEHALDADHLTAVAALTSEEKGWRRSFLLGVRWGAGHAVTLFAAGCAVLLLRWPMPLGLASWGELAVGAMLVVLGGRVFWRIWQENVHIHPHRHGKLLHVHFHSHRRGPATGPVRVCPFRWSRNRRGGLERAGSPPGVPKRPAAWGPPPGAAWPPGHEHVHGLRPLLVGMVHGLAGSAGLLLLVAATTPSAAQALAYILALGLGAALAMGVLSAAFRLPLAWAEGRSEVWSRWVRGAAGLASVAFGVFLMVSRGGG